VKEPPSFTQKPRPFFWKPSPQPVPQPETPVTTSADRSKEPTKVIVVDDDDFEFHTSEQPHFVVNNQSNTSPIAVRSVPGTSAYPKANPDPSDNLMADRANKLRDFSMRRTPEISETMMVEPAFRRRNVQFEPANHSSESYASNYHLFPGEDGKLIMQPNPYLHDNVD